MPDPNPRIALRQLAAAMAILYVLLAAAYGVTLELTSGWEARHLAERMALDYSIKAVLSAGIAWLIFRGLPPKPAYLRASVAVALALPFAFAWQATYYAVCDAIGIGHLGARGSWWDIYIPLLVYAFQFALLFAADYHNRSLAALQRAEAAQRAAEASELAALKAQVNPHFLYNTFNAISAGLPAREEATRETLATLADLCRYQLAASSRDRVTLDEELGFVRDYLELHALRMDERLRYEIVVDDEATASAQVAPMLLQPLVENALAHGLAPQLSGGCLRVSVSRRSDRIRFEVEDDGAGFDPQAHASPRGTGVGLANTRRRLRLVYDTDLHVRSAPGAGTCVWYELPVEAVAPGPVGSEAQTEVRAQVATAASSLA